MAVPKGQKENRKERRAEAKPRAKLAIILGAEHGDDEFRNVHAFRRCIGFNSLSNDLFENHAYVGKMENTTVCLQTFILNVTENR